MLWITICQQLDNLQKMDKLLEMPRLPKLTKEEIENVIRPIINE